MNNFFAFFLPPKNYKTQTISKEKLQEALLYEEATHKMLVKLTFSEFTINFWVTLPF